MKKMTAPELRARFHDFFAARGHTVVPSSPLAPLGDPTLLFTTAGMVQFKPYYGLDPDRLPYRRACSIQKCVRLTDLENVGKTPRHDTFFEMLGNFSFGDYFKREAIEFAWDFCTVELELPVERLHVSIFNGEGGVAPVDEEARGFWMAKGVSADHIVEMGRKDNFWGPAGGTGACGPCSEIYFDLGPDACTCGGGCNAGDDCPRYMEFWNLVFPQYDAQADGSMPPLARPGIDTGMGLERLALIVQEKTSIFETDLFAPVVAEVARLAGLETLPALGRPDDAKGVAVCIIADHVRALTFALGEGIAPSNEGRGYVLRRLLRRASRNGRLLGLTGPFLVHACAIVIDHFLTDYPELGGARRRILGVVGREEENFLRTFDQGLARFEKLAADAKAKGQAVLAGDDVFQLHDTYGFLVDLTAEMAAEHGLAVDDQGFERAMNEQRTRARKAGAFGGKKAARDAGPAWTEFAGADDAAASEFVGYEALEAISPVVRWRALPDGNAELVLATTPFYAESGGQVADSGRLEGRNVGGVVRLQVLHVRKDGDAIVHRVHALEGALPVTEVRARVDAVARAATRRNHTATHLLHAALRRALGDHVLQAGSLVAPERLRFDYSHFEAPTPEQLRAVEDDVNRAVLANFPVAVEVRSLEDARKSGAIALFGEKYEDEVRVIRIVDSEHGDLVSAELCGGTHVSRTGDIGLFRIVSDESIASGTRRLEAVTGQLLVDWSRGHDELVQRLASTLKSRPEELVQRVDSLRAEIDALRKREKDRLKGGLDDEVRKAVERSVRGSVRGSLGSWVIRALPSGDSKYLREASEKFIRTCPAGASVFVGLDPEKQKTSWAVAIGSELQSHWPITALDILTRIGLSGGGQKHLAMGGSRSDDEFTQYLERLRDYLSQEFHTAKEDTWAEKAANK